MLRFIGSAEVSIDGKQRLGIPAKHRQQLNPEVNGGGWVCVPGGAGVLKLFPRKKFEELCARYEESATSDENTEAWELAFYGDSEELEMDTAGRVTLPKSMLQEAGLGTGVAVVGAGNRLEVRARESWAAEKGERRARMKDLNRLAEERRRESGDGASGLVGGGGGSGGSGVGK